MEIEQEILGFAPDGQPAILYRMTNRQRVETQHYQHRCGHSVVGGARPRRQYARRGARIQYVRRLRMNDPAAMCKSVGRYANRIAEGTFLSRRQGYILARNNGVNHLHGGPGGFQNKIWTSRVETDRVVFSYTSAAGEGGLSGRTRLRSGLRLRRRRHCRDNLFRRLRRRHYRKPHQPHLF